MQSWDGDLWLFTPEELEQLPDGIELTSIMGKKVVKGRDYIDDDTRGGHLAYGIREPFKHELKDLFMEWYMKR